MFDDFVLKADRRRAKRSCGCATEGRITNCFSCMGHPRTHVTWDRVAPLLARAHTVVCPDLRGYGSRQNRPRPRTTSPYSKRAMARDCVALMRVLGHEAVRRRRSTTAACYVAFRLAIDHPDVATHLVRDGRHTDR